MQAEQDFLMNKYVRVFLWVFLVGAFCFLTVFMWKRGDMLTDSDITSEMLLAQVASEENVLISPNWYYSTELRVLNIQLIYSLFFHFFSDWTLVRTASCAASYLLMLVSCYYLLNQAGMKKYFTLSAIFLLLPFSDNYFEYVLLALLYATFITISFFAVGMLLHYAKASPSGKKILLGAMIILAFFAGLGGARHVAVLYAPMLGAVIFLSIVERKPSVYLAGSVSGFVAAVAGYLVNAKILAASYHFLNWNSEMHFGFSFQGIWNIIFGVLRFFGYSYGDVRTPVLSAFSCLVVLVIAVCLLGHVIKNIKNPDAGWLISVYIICAYGFFTVLYSFTDMLYSDRYGMSVLMFAVPVTIAGLCETKWKKPLKVGLCAILACGFLASSVFRYVHYGRMDKTEEFRSVVKLLQEEGVAKGYATFWSGNVLTELSDGGIEVWCLENTPSETGIDDLLDWLQRADHLTTHPEGPVFLFLSEEEYEAWSTCPAREEAVYDSGEYVLFFFDDYSELKREVEG